MLLDTLRSLKSYRPGIAYILSNTLYLAPTACSPAARTARLCREQAQYRPNGEGPRLAEAWGSLGHDLALRVASGGATLFRYRTMRSCRGPYFEDMQSGYATLDPARFSSRSAAPLPASRASQQAASTEDTGFQPLVPGEAEPTAEELAALVEEFFSACGDSGGNGGAVAPLQEVAVHSVT